jgi:hypothetical protein
MGQETLGKRNQGAKPGFGSRKHPALKQNDVVASEIVALLHLQPFRERLRLGFNAHLDGWSISRANQID